MRTVGDVLQNHRAFLIDNWGVLRRGKSTIPGVSRSFDAIRSFGNRPILVSNTATFSVGGLQSEFRLQGIDLAPEEIVTSGMALAPYFAQHELKGKNILVVGNEITNDCVRQAGGIPLLNRNIIEHFQMAAAVVVGWYPAVPPESTNRLGLMSLEVVHAAINALRLNNAVRGVVANADVTYPLDDRITLFGSGALGHLIEECSGRILDYLGKPHEAIYRIAFGRLEGVPRDQIVMVGDSLNYDIQGARNVGIKSLLVLSGNTKLDDLKRSPLKPDFLAETFLPEAPLLEIPS